MNSKIFSDAFREFADKIDAGNTNATEDELIELCGMISLMVNPESKRSKYQAIKHLNVSRATFDNYVKRGLIPKGREQQGFKEKFWYNKDLWNLKKALDG